MKLGQYHLLPIYQPFAVSNRITGHRDNFLIRSGNEYERLRNFLVEAGSEYKSDIRWIVPAVFQFYILMSGGQISRSGSSGAAPE